MIDRPLIVMALPTEGQGLIEPLGFPLLYCGVGKINACYHLTRALLQAESRGTRFSYVLNLGTAGSRQFATGSLVECTSFLQRDMDATGLGFVHGQTPFDETPRRLEFARRFAHLPAGVCSSGDSFLQGPCPVQGEVIDMEAYALAKVCFYLNMPFACVKFITDGSDSDAHLDWQSNLVHAAQGFAGLLARV